MSFWLNSYYIVVLAWSLYYIYSALSSDVPWRSCDNWWNTENCRSEYEPFNCSAQLRSCPDPKLIRSPVKEYWE
ncbi:hypothetical protein HPB52_021504 [Rhipicephalus sanguineus]|uniref:Uncharacterized protein n=2 Tax=Rhipicephalus sanguineus TaxID=34632 RepID=A0A9D4QFG9_RHISA|nr:hypothetical protein HPB52_021504 [Rhipicephalus sanguineus]